MERGRSRAVPRDPMLPDLPGLVLDRGAPAFVGRALRESLGVEVEPGQATLAYVHYRPTLSCTVLWSFPRPSGGALLVSGRRVRRGRAARIASRPSTRRRAAHVAWATGRDRSPCLYLPEWQLLLEAFPMDARLRGLPWAASRAWLDATLVPVLGLEGARLVEAEPVAYRPWQRCVFRYRVETRLQRPRYFAKLFHDEQGEALAARLQTLGEGLRAAGAPWQVPEPVAYLRDQRMLVTPEIGEGRKLNRLLRPARKHEEVRAGLLRDVARAASGLRFLQQLSGAGLARVSPHELLAGFRGFTARLPRVAPQLARRVEAALRTLERAAERLLPEPLVATHGAFRLDQLLPGADRLGVLDLDTLCRSGASADAGNFLAYLDALALRRPRLEPVMAACRSAFLEALAEPTPGGSGWLSWYRAASLVKVSFRSFLTLAPGWPQRSHDLLGRAEEELASLSA